MIRVVIADDHHLVRAGIRALLEKAEDIDVVGEAVDGRAAVDGVRALAPDVLVMDVNMPVLNGVQALAELATLATPTQTVILSMYSDESVVRQTLQLGARGYLLKGAVTEELLLAIRAASRGATYLSPSVSAKIAGVLNTPAGDPPASPVARLTDREREVVRLIGAGHTNNQIAQLMHVSVKTVERHRTNLMAKLEARNLVELIRLAIKYGLIDLDS